MRRSRNREINVFSVSAIDLFACGMGVFIILYMVLIPLVTQQVEIPTAKAPATELAPLEGDLQSKNQELTKALMSEKLKNEELVAMLAAANQTMRDAQVQWEEASNHAAQEIADLRSELSNLKGRFENLKNQKNPNKPVLDVDVRRDEGGEGGGNSEKVKNLYIQVKLEWSTSSHDVDLIVVDPRGNEFSTTTLQFPKIPGRHFGNTQGGPGFEIWQSYEGYAGTYRIYAVLRNYNRNKENAEVEGMVELNRGTIKMPHRSLAHLDERELVLQFTVDSDGQYKVIGD